MNYTDEDFQKLQQEVREIRGLLLVVCRMFSKEVWQTQVNVDARWRTVQQQQDMERRERGRT